MEFVIEAEWASGAIEGDANMQSSDLSNYRGKINESLQMHGSVMKTAMFTLVRFCMESCAMVK
jgi:hypothetical protein